VLSRPDDLNPVTTTLLNELDKAIDLVEANDDSRALLITGAGDTAFYTGADLQFTTDDLEPYEAVGFS
jgi:enoyl-CoA hydratase/3-hydroxyacyl-CoA dehydrogenase